MNSQYASADLDGAEATLVSLLDECASNCGASVIGRAWMYIGIVRGSGRDDLVGAQQAFSEAKAADPTVVLDELFATDLVRRVFTKTEASRRPSLIDELRSKTQTDVDEEVECTLTATEVETGRPVPLECRYLGDNAVDRMSLHFKHESQSLWSALEFEQERTGFVGTVPCESTATTGVLSYYVEVHLGPKTLARLGSAQKPQTLRVVTTTKQPPPRLPGASPPARCGVDAGNAAAPVAPAQVPSGGYGDSCESDDDCAGGLSCNNGECQPNRRCRANEDCVSGVCTDGTCELSSPEPTCSGDDCDGHASRHWIGVQVATDIAWIGGDGVCGLTADSRYSCFIGDQPYRGVPNSNYAGAINAGLQLSTSRLLASYERPLFGPVALELRGGFAVGGGPASSTQAGGDGSRFLPLHAEARAKLYLTPLYNGPSASTLGVAPYLVLGGGVGQVDAHRQVPVAECAVSRAAITPEEQACIDSTNLARTQRSVDVYQRMGQGFLTGGVGVRYGISRRWAVTGALHASMLLPATGFSLSPSIAVTTGL